MGFYAREYHYEHVMCYLFDKNASILVKTINIVLLICFYYLSL
jgi:hypothetical protein